MRYISIALLIVFLTSCANSYQRFTDYNNFQGFPYKAMAVGVNSYGEQRGGYAWAGGKTIKEAEDNALKNCRNYAGKYDCILEMSNGRNVFYTNSIEYKNAFQAKLAFQRQKQAEENLQRYIASIRQVCMNYGFRDENAIAGCVRNEMLRREQQVAQQNSINAQNRANALREIGKTLTEMGQPQAPATQTKRICAYKCGFETVTVDEFICPGNLRYNGQICYPD